jgi:hypothetical protein
MRMSYYDAALPALGEAWMLCKQWHINIQMSMMGTMAGFASLNFEAAFSHVADHLQPIALLSLAEV